MSLQYYCTIRVYDPANAKPITFWYEVPYFDLIDSARPGMVLARADTYYDDTKAIAQIKQAFEQIKRSGKFRFPVLSDNASGIFALQTALNQGYLVGITIGLLQRVQKAPPKPIQGGLKLDYTKVVAMVPYKGSSPDGGSSNYYVVSFEYTEAKVRIIEAPA
jgi:hypothetical protein